MIRHRQLPHIPGERPGNCLQVSLATVLDEPVLGRIPHVAMLDPDFVEMSNKYAWWGVVLDTVSRYGAAIWIISSSSRGTPLDPGLFPLTSQVPAGQELVGVIGCGPSPRGSWGHAVVVDVNGHLLHDPHVSDAGVPYLDEVWLICRPTPATQLIMTRKAA